MLSVHIQKIFKQCILASFYGWHYAVFRSEVINEGVKRKTKISIMVPAWNEEERLPKCMERLLEFTREWKNTCEIVICADGSTDRTLSIANEYASNNSNVRVSYWPKRLGKGGGLLHGLNKASGNIVVFTDVDLSASPDQIPKLIAPINRAVADMVIGSRNLRESIITEEPPTHRKILGRVFNFLFRKLFHSDLHDTQCGFKAIKSEAFRILADEISIRGYTFDIDLIVKALKKGYRVTEIPIVWGYREGSKVNSFRQSFAMGRSLLLVWFENQKKEPKP